MARILLPQAHEYACKSMANSQRVTRLCHTITIVDASENGNSAFTRNRRTSKTIANVLFSFKSSLSSYVAKRTAWAQVFGTRSPQCMVLFYKLVPYEEHIIHAKIACMIYHHRFYKCFPDIQHPAGHVQAGCFRSKVTFARLCSVFPT